MSVSVFIGIVYIVPTILGLYVVCCLHQYCMYHANNLGDIYKLLGVFGPFSIFCIFIHCIFVFVFCIFMIDNSTYHFRHPCTLCFPKKHWAGLTPIVNRSHIFICQGAILSIASVCIDNYNTHNKLYSFVFIQISVWLDLKSHSSHIFH